MKSWISPHLSGVQIARVGWFWPGGHACGYCGSCFEIQADIVHDCSVTVG